MRTEDGANGVMLAEIIEAATEAVEVHLDMRESILTTRVNGWARRERVSWSETAAELMAWIIGQVEEALRVYRVLVEMATEMGPVGPLVSPVAPEMMGARG